MGFSPLEGNFNTPSSSWGNYSSANLLGGHNTNTLVTTDNATWQLTGVQLEVRISPRHLNTEILMKNIVHV